MSGLKKFNPGPVCDPNISHFFTVCFCVCLRVWLVVVTFKMYFVNVLGSFKFKCEATS